MVTSNLPLKKKIKPDLSRESSRDFNVTHQKLRTWDNLPNFRPGVGAKGNIPKTSSNLNENHNVKFSISENPTVEVSPQSSYIKGYRILY